LFSFIIISRKVYKISLVWVYWCDVWSTKMIGHCKYCTKDPVYVIKDAVPTEVSGERDEGHEDVYRRAAVCEGCFPRGIQAFLLDPIQGEAVVDRLDKECPNRDLRRTSQLVDRINK
jgi:hypothetical protein